MRQLLKTDFGRYRVLSCLGAKHENRGTTSGASGGTMVLIAQFVCPSFRCVLWKVECRNAIANTFIHVLLLSCFSTEHESLGSTNGMHYCMLFYKNTVLWRPPGLVKRDVSEFPNLRRLQCITRIRLQKTLHPNLAFSCKFVRRKHSEKDPEKRSESRGEQVGYM
jgi:hypothetical protein